MPNTRSPGSVASFTVAVESPLSDDARALVTELNQVLLALTPPEFCSHLTVEQLAGATTTFWVARHRDGTAVGCGALQRHGAVGEVKRMYTRPAAQGWGIGGAVVDHIVATARTESLTSVVLETGDRHPAAWRVYERAGFTRCGPVLDYPESPWSVFYELPLTQEDTRR